MVHLLLQEVVLAFYPCPRIESFFELHFVPTDALQAESGCDAQLPLLTPP